jgi:replicative DNA helicase
MEQTLSKALPYRKIKDPTDEIIKYITDRRHGIVRSLKTRWPKFNSQCMGGIEPNVIYTVAGISGSGKSAFANSLETDLFDNNPDVEFVVLSFNFEMLASRQIGRKLSYKLAKTTQELYSSGQDILSEADYQAVLNEAKQIERYPIYYVDIPGTVEQVRATILHFMELPEVKNKWVVIFLDHTLLTKGKTGNSEREILSDLQHMFMEIKKYGSNTIIQLSQLNREIETVDRISKPNMHFPIRRDIFGSESVFQASDYLLVLHRPELLGLREYGPSNWDTTNLIYMHFLKNREGKPAVIRFRNNLNHNRIDEASSVDNE